MKLKSIVLAAGLIFVSAVSAFADAPNLFARYGGKTVKVYVVDPQTSTQVPEITASDLKGKLEETLKARSSIRFVMVSSAEEADLVIQMNLKGYLWTDHDPIDMIVGIGGTAMDTAMIEDYASLEADVTVLDGKRNSVLWKDTIRGAVTKKPMSREDSIPLVTDELIKNFIKRCFAKRR